MPTYSYECRCGSCFDAVRPISGRRRAKCQACGSSAKMVFPPRRPPAAHGFKLGYFEHLSKDGEYVKSKKHLQELCHRHGVYAPGVLD